jgi:hypothetical protein
MGTTSSWRNGRRPAIKTWFRAAAWASTAVGIIALLIGNAAASDVASPVALKKLSAPYAGTATATVFEVLGGCGYSAKVPVSPSFDLKTGRALLSAKAAAHSCGSANSTAFIGAEPWFTSSPFSGVGGTRHMVETWVLNLSVDLVIVSGNGEDTAYFYVEPWITLTDLTTLSSYSVGTTILTHTIWAGGTYSHNYTERHAAVSFNFTLNATNSYEIGAQLDIGVGVFVAPGAGSASASLDMGSPGWSATLRSITGA